MNASTTAGTGPAPDGTEGRRPPRLAPVTRSALRLVLLHWIFFLTMRVVFLQAFRDSGGAFEGADLRRAFAVGARFDLRLALLMVTPLMVLGRLPGLRPTGLLRRRAWFLLQFLLGLFVVLAYVTDLGHYEYLHERLAAAVLNEALSVPEAIGMVRETYPVLPASLALLAFLVGYVLVLLVCLRPLTQGAAPEPRLRRTRGAVVWILFLWGLYGSASWYPLRWSEAYFSTNRFVSSLALNPVLNFLESFGKGTSEFDEQKLRDTAPVLEELYGFPVEREGVLSLAREVPAGDPGRRRGNLVVIHVESWAGFQTGFLGNPLPSSPRMDALAAESVVFERAFVPSGPTARSVFSMLTGVPDTHIANPVTTASRNPRMVTQHVLVDDLPDHEKLYFLGGSANWANIRAVIEGNIEGVRIFEEGSYGGGRVDTWGVSDLTLLRKAVDELDACEGPFFAFLQTSGNHRPYTIPDDNAGFERSAALDEEELRAAGFKSLEAYDGFRFLDHALGEFFELARERDWYADTLFVLYGDHGVACVNEVPYKALQLTHNHVPLVFHGPRFTGEPRRVREVASTLDVLPTGLSLIGEPYTNTAFGRDLWALERDPDAERFAFLYFGLVEGSDRLLLADPLRGWTWHAIGGWDEPSTDLGEQEPQRMRRAIERFDALREWTRWALFHNPSPRR